MVKVLYTSIVHHTTCLKDAQNAQFPYNEKMRRWEYEKLRTTDTSGRTEGIEMWEVSGKRSTLSSSCCSTQVSTLVEETIMSELKLSEAEEQSYSSAGHGRWTLSEEYESLTGNSVRDKSKSTTPQLVFAIML